MSTTVVTGEAVVLQLRPASFVVRAAGALIDGLALVLVFLGILWVLGQTILETLDPAALQATVLSLVVGLVVGVPLAVETLSRGRSLGKLVFGMRVVRDDGGAIRLRHSLVRVLLGIFEVWMSFGSVALIASMLNERGKRLADMVAGTQVEVLQRDPGPPAGVTLEDFLLGVVAERRNRDYRMLTRRLERTEASAERLHSLPFT